MRELSERIDLGEQPRDVLVLRNIGLEYFGARAGCPAFPGDFQRGIPIAGVIDRDVVTLLRRQAADRGADAARAAGDEEKGARQVNPPSSVRR